MNSFYFFIDENSIKEKKKRNAKDRLDSFIDKNSISRGASIKYLKGRKKRILYKNKQITIRNRTILFFEEKSLFIKVNSHIIV